MSDSSSRSNGPAPLYSRSKIAAALGVGRAEAVRLLPSYRADAFTLRAGGGPAWTLPGLPAAVRDRLHGLAIEAGRSVDELLAAPPRRWLTPAALLRVRPSRFNCAVALRHHLAPFFVAWNRLSVAGRTSEKELVNDAPGLLPDLTRVIGASFVKTLVRRALRRDGHTGSWTRLDLYLYGYAPRVGADGSWEDAVMRTLPATNYHLSIFEEVARFVQNPGALSNGEKIALWEASFVSAIGREWADSNCRHADVRVRSEALWWVRRRTLQAILRSRVALLATRRAIVREWQGYYEFWKERGELHPKLGLGRGRTRQ